MAEKLEDWINSHVKNYKSMDDGDIYYGKFFREENRPIIRDPLAFYSPADGTIFYQRKVRPDQKLLEVKGKKYALTDLMMEDDLKDIDYYVMGIFMSYYDVHVNRIPTDGVLKYTYLDSIKSNNLPMIFVEKGIFANDLNYKNLDAEYLFNNERMRNDIRYMKKGINYTVMQIADKDVDNITPFSVDNPDNFTQCERFSFIRWGSECDLIIPSHPRYDFKFVQKELYHVKAGIDKVVQIIEK